MRKFLTLCLVLTVGAGIAAAGEGHAWFDMENCGMCSNLNDNPEMLWSLGWDHHKTATGAVVVTTVPEQYTEEFAACSAKMEAAGQKLMAGEQMALCGMCQSFMGIMASGKAAMEKFDTPNGDVTVISSTDAETIKMIHKHTDKTLAAMAEMAAAQQEGR